MDYDNGCPQRLLMIAKCDLVDENRLKSYIALLSSSMKSSVRDGSGANFREKAEGWASPNLRPWRATAFNEAGTRKQNSVGTPAGWKLSAIPANAKPKLASLRNEIVVWIDDNKRSDLFIKLQI